MANLITQIPGACVPGLGTRHDYVAVNVLSMVGVATGDILYALTLPAGHRCNNITVKVLTATGATTTATVGVMSDLVGSAVSATGFDGSTNLNATAGTLTTGAGGTDAYVTAGGYLNLTPADTYIALTVTTNATCTVGSIAVIAECTDLTYY